LISTLVSSNYHTIKIIDSQTKRGLDFYFFNYNIRCSNGQIDDGEQNGILE
jgi:xanthine dehydrogenase molybdopterin-binding subunit B